MDFGIMLIVAISYLVVFGLGYGFGFRRGVIKMVIRFHAAIDKIPTGK